MNVSLSPITPENLVLRETDSVVPSRVILLIRHTQAESGAYSRVGFLPLPAVAAIYLYHRQPPSSHSWVRPITQLRTDGVRCRESAGIGQVPLKRGSFSNNWCGLFRYQHGPISVRLSFSTPIIGGGAYYQHYSNNVVL